MDPSTHYTRFLSELGSVDIPPAHCSFPWHLHPHYLQLKDVSDAWIFSRFATLPSFSSFTNDGEAKCRYDFLVALTYSNGITERLIPVVKFIVWLFIFDNFLDDPKEMGADPAAADRLITGFLTVLEPKDDAAAASPSPTCAVTRLMNDTAHDWWDVFRQDMPVTQRLRFIQAFKDYLNAIRAQVGYRHAQQLPDVETFGLLRGDAGAWYCCCVLIEYVLAVELDEETLAHPLVRNLRTSAAFHVYWLNDLISFKKEILQGDYMNLIPVMYFSSKTTPPSSLQQIVLKVSQMIKDMDDDCVRLVNEIKKSELLMGKPRLPSFLEGVGRCLGGNFYWHLVSPRYPCTGVEPQDCQE